VREPIQPTNPTLQGTKEHVKDCRRGFIGPARDEVTQALHARSVADAVCSSSMGQSID